MLPQQLALGLSMTVSGMGLSSKAVPLLQALGGLQQCCAFNTDVTKNQGL
jgi:hypothetical protein